MIPPLPAGNRLRSLPSSCCQRTPPHRLSRSLLALLCVLLCSQALLLTSSTSSLVLRLVCVHLLHSRFATRRPTRSIDSRRSTSRRLPNLRSSDCQPQSSCITSTCLFHCGRGLCRFSSCRSAPNRDTTLTCRHVNQLLDIPFLLLLLLRRCPPPVVTGLDLLLLWRVVRFCIADYHFAHHG